MKNNKNYDLDTLFGGNISKLLIGLLGVSVLALVLYFGVSLAGKGTFSSIDNFVPEHVYCYVHKQITNNIVTHTIKEKVYITECEGTESNSICRGRLYEENINMDYGEVSADNVYYYGELYDEDYWACEKDFNNYSKYMCDNYGQITYIAGCRKYDEYNGLLFV